MTQPPVGAMTTIDFYTHCTDRFEVAAKLVAKAWTQHGSARVLTPDPDVTDRFDRFLWQWPALGFVPHCRLDSPSRPRRRWSSITR